MSGDVEGVALAVAEAVDDGSTDAALLVDGLFERASCTSHASDSGAL